MRVEPVSKKKAPVRHSSESVGRQIRDVQISSADAHSEYQPVIKDSPMSCPPPCGLKSFLYRLFPMPSSVPKAGKQKDHSRGHQGKSVAITDELSKQQFTSCG